MEPGSSELVVNSPFTSKLVQALSEPPLSLIQGKKYEDKPTPAAEPGSAQASLPSTSNPHEELTAGGVTVPPSASADLGPVPSIQNVVSTVNLGCTLDLQKITTRTRNCDYNPKRFCGAVMRIREPRSTALVFSSGKIVVTGVRHENNSVLASKKYARILQRIGFPIKFMDFKIHNMVATVDLRFPIKLENLNQAHGQFSSYEPELFPALIYRMVKPRVVLLVFVNGKLVITGAKTREDIHAALDNIMPILQSFRKQ